MTSRRTEDDFRRDLEVKRSAGEVLARPHARSTRRPTCSP